MRKSFETWIKLEECKDRHVYKLYSRNLGVGIFEKDRSRFIGIRNKFGSRFLSTEDHWDADDVYGTAKPYEDLGPMPEDILLTVVDNRPIFDYLDSIKVEDSEESC